MAVVPAGLTWRGVGCRVEGGGATTQRICCPFPLEWRFPRKTLLFKPRSEIRDSPSLCAVAVAGSGELGGRREEVGGGGVSSWKM